MIDTDELLDAARAGLATGAVEADGDAVARVSLWRSGSRLALAEASGPDPLAAARAAAARLMETDASDAAVLVEAVAERGPIEVEGLSGLIGSTLGSPDGLLLRDGENFARGWPFDALRTEGRHAAWAKQLNRQARPPGARLASSTSIERFGTIEAMGPVAVTDEDEVVAPRLAGFRVVDPNEVLADRMIGAAFQSAAWLLRHQRQDGFFAYEFLPATQSWSNADSIVRQSGCAWAVALVGRLGREPNISRAAAGAVEALLRTTLKRDGPGRLYYLAAQGEPPRLGAIPLLLLAIAELAQAATVSREVVDQLAATLLGHSGALGPAGGDGARARAGGLGDVLRGPGGTGAGASARAAQARPLCARDSAGARSLPRALGRRGRARPVVHDLDAAGLRQLASPRGRGRRGGVRLCDGRLGAGVAARAGASASALARRVSGHARHRHGGIRGGDRGGAGAGAPGWRRRSARRDTRRRCARRCAFCCS